MSKKKTKKNKAKRKPTHDPVIMQALLDEPNVKKSVDKMTDLELVYFKQMLIKQKTYFHYEVAYKAKQLEAQVASELREAEPNKKGQK